MPTGQSPDKVTFENMMTTRALTCQQPFDVDVHRHTGSSHKEDKYRNGSNGHNMTKNLGYTYVQNQSIFLFKKCVTIILFL